MAEQKVVQARAQAALAECRRKGDGQKLAHSGCYGEHLFESECEGPLEFCAKAPLTIDAVDHCDWPWGICTRHHEEKHASDAMVDVLVEERTLIVLADCRKAAGNKTPAELEAIGRKLGQGSCILGYSSLYGTCEGVKEFCPSMGLWCAYHHKVWHQMLEETKVLDLFGHGISTTGGA